MRIAANCSQLHAKSGDGIAVLTQNVLANIDADCYYHPLDNIPKFMLLASWYGWTYTGLSTWLNIKKPDVLINFDVALPLYKPSVHILYDIVPLIVKDAMTKINTKVFGILTQDAINRASKLVTISHSSRKEIERYYELEDNTIKVIYPGYDREMFKPRYDCEVMKRYGINKRYALFVGTLSLKKNIARIIEAFHKADVEDMELILIGQLYALGGEDLEKLGKKNVRHLGYLPSEDLVVLLSNAAMFVWPSLHEGFGLPVLEAMACGCPVITSNRSALPEVTCGAGILVDPYNVDEIAKAIKLLAGDRVLRSELIAKGLKRAKEFSWQRTARELVETCEEVSRNKSRKK